MNKGLEVARGKTKVLYEVPDQPDVLVVTQQDNISAGDGARRNTIAGKGRLAAKTTARVFRLLNLCGLPTHYLSGGEDDDDNEMLVRRCTMIPLEVVVRGVAAGSLVRRKPGIARGSIIVPRMIEFFFKDDANHDPLIEPDEIVRRGIASPAEIALMSEIARINFEILAHAWRRRETLLVDLKIEFGRLSSGENRGALVIADVIDNDSWRIWPQGREDLMLDKQMYRNLSEVTQADLDRVFASYERVAEMVGSFPQMRPGMVAIVADGPEAVSEVDDVARAVAQFGLPSVRRVASALRTPGFALQLVQQLDATYPRLVFIAVGALHSGLGDFLEGATPTPVLRTAILEPEPLAMAAAKMFAVEDTVMFGRVLLVQANARSAVLQADAVIATPSTAPNGFVT
jgi:phosphoribosylaminoimidazole-succinocarboxamide synthase